MDTYTINVDVLLLIGLVKNISPNGEITNVCFIVICIVNLQFIIESLYGNFYNYSC